MFGLTDEQLLSHGIKIIDGIAGGGKSSKIDRFFRDRGIEYARFTSTNRLRRDAIDRYNMPVQTIAAGLFENHGLRFYAEEKDAPCEHIVIDEILQADPKAIDWCLHHSDVCNIIITTDSKQLLSPENEAKMVSAFNTLKSTDGVIYTTVTETLRPRTPETKVIYDKFYGIADSIQNYTTVDIKAMFNNVINYSDMEYNLTDAYITHDNVTEDYLYKDKEFANMPYLDLIPKGGLASKPPTDLSKYPVLSQIQANKTHARAYTQVMNVGSPVRFQGSEVIDTQKLYFILQPHSIVTARELYTVLTRMWDINSLVIVICDTPTNYTLKTFRGLPVKTHRYLMVDEPIGESTQVLTNKQMDELCSKYDTDTIYYDRDQVRDAKHGTILYSRSGYHGQYFDNRKSSAGSIARRDASLNYSFMDDVYSTIEPYGITHLRAIHNKTRRTNEGYELDIRSAHPTMLKFEKMPADGIILKDHPHDDMLNFYLFDGKDTKFTDKSIITDDMKNYLESHNIGTCTYLFSTPYVTGTFPGEYLYAKTHNTKEDKANVKSDIHYGYYQKPYLTLSLMEDCYVRNENHIYELLICQIFSQLTYYMTLLSDALNASSIIVDAVIFPCYNEDTVEIVKSILPEYVEFRIMECGSDKEHALYKNYEELLTREEKTKERKRNWYANLTPEQKAERARKQRERRAEKRRSQNEQK